MFWPQGANRGFTPLAGRGAALGQYMLPAYSQELISPVHWREEKHCYACPDGTYRFMTLLEARAMGCAPVPRETCASYPAMAGKSMGQAVVTTPAYVAPANGYVFPWLPVLLGLGAVAAVVAIVSAAKD